MSRNSVTKLKRKRKDQTTTMNDIIQKTLDAARAQMQAAQGRTYSAAAGTHVLHAFVAVLSRQFLTEGQQAQLESILDIHLACVRGDGRRKE